MLRIVAPLMLLLALALSGCDDGNGSDSAGADGGDETSASPSESPSAAEDDSPSGATEPSPTGQVTTKAFCDGIHPILTAQTGEKRGEAAMELLSEGLPADMSQSARSGLQVLVDLSPYFDDTRELFRTYYALGETDKTDVHAFAGYVTTECGADLIKDLMPTLPDDLVADLPSELASLVPKR